MIEQSTNQQIKLHQQTFIIVVFGLPASGKSTFSHHLKNNLFPQALLISVDSIELLMQSDPQLIAQLQHLQSQQLIKQFLLIQTNKTSINIKPKFNADNWKQSRKLIEYIVQQLVKKCSVILEDDFLLRSQRKVYRKISFVSKVKYLQIYMDSSLEECLDNLQHRNLVNTDCVVTEEIVRKSAQKIQIQSESEYTMKICQKQRQNVNTSQIRKRMKIVQIQPNDPNNPDFYHPKQKHSHTVKQLLQISVRRFVNQLMNLTTPNLVLKFGQIMVNTHSLNNKKVLSGIVNDWKKIYVGSKDASICHQLMLQNFKNYVSKKKELQKQEKIQKQL